jgi:Na+-transporting methylmalonyl-CoA/oxaloacetate decarboxylase gamma subunit
MYCPSCGSELTSELSYCNRCGANLKPLSNQSGEARSKLVGATWAISLAVMLVTLGGFGMMFALVMTLISTGVNLSGGGMALIVFCLLIILAVVSLLVRQLSRVIDLAQLSAGATQSKQPPQPTLSEKPVPQISAPREPVTSVTEHTTRMFEPILKDRDTQR